MSYLIDPSGRWWRWPSQVLAEKLGYPDPDFDLAGYAVRNLGYVWLVVESNVTFLQFRTGSVGGATLGSLKPYLMNASAAKPVGLIYFASGWMEEVHTDAPLLHRRMVELAGLREPRMRDLFIREPQKPLDWSAANSSSLAQLFSLWRASGGQLTPVLQEFLRRTALDQRTVFAQQRSDGGFRVQESGNGFSIYDSFSMGQLVGRLISDQPDRAYGQWIAQAYGACHDSGEPLVDDVDAIVEAPDHDPRRRRYQRLILPWRDDKGDVTITGSSLLKTDIAIPFDLRVR